LLQDSRVAITVRPLVLLWLRGTREVHLFEGSLSEPTVIVLSEGDGLVLLEPCSSSLIVIASVANEKVITRSPFFAVQPSEFLVVREAVSHSRMKRGLSRNKK
jgi:hypothetical protein